MTSKIIISSSVAIALDQEKKVHDVTPCPSDTSCCTDCGVSSSSSCTGFHSQSADQVPLHHHGEVKIPMVVVQMTEGQIQKTPQQNIPTGPIIVPQTPVALLGSHL